MAQDILFKEDFHKIKFKCKKCCNCCQNSNIRLSPYDLLRLCKRLNLTTMEFHQKYSYFILDKENRNILTCMLKTALQCLFLVKEGCRVYEDRPFGCRIFPLAVQPSFDGKNFESKFYVLENCPGSDTKKKISLQEFKKEQELDALEFYEPWVKFKIAAINSSFPETEEYYFKFMTICYNFDDHNFKTLLKQLNLKEQESIKERYNLIIELANKLLI